MRGSLSVSCLLALGVSVACADVARISGTVRETGGQGLGGVLVTDGHRIVATDAEGAYAIDVPAGEDSVPADVSIVIPSGFGAVGRFWRVIGPETDGAFAADFELRKDAATSNKDFSFAVVSDLHLRGLPFLGHLDTIRPAPAFVAVLGDLCNNSTDGKGDPRPLVSYGNIFHEEIALPVFSTFGNHDWSKPPDAARDQTWHYRVNIAPVQYAFEWGGRLFIVLHYLELTPKPWVGSLLARYPKDTEVILLQHFPASVEQIEWLGTLEHSIRAVLSGHVHSNYLYRWGEIVEFNTPPFHLGGKDYSPMAYRMVRFEGNEMHGTVHPIEGHALRILSPRGKVAGRDGRLDVVVRAYDPWVPVSQVRVRLMSDGPETSVRLERAGSSTWRGGLKLPDHFKQGQIEASATNLAGSDLPPSVSPFEVVSGPKRSVVLDTPWPQFRRSAAGTASTPDLVRPPLRLAWVWASQATIDFSSPVTDGQRIFIGIRDEANHGRQGIAALDAATGRTRWRVKTRQSVRHTVAVLDGKVFAVGFDGEVVARGARTGEPVWEQSLPQEYGRFYSGVTTDGRALYLRSHSRTFALDPGTGDVLWSQQSPGGSAHAYSTPIAGHGRVFVGTTVLDAVTGEKLHEGESNEPSATLLADTLYFRDAAWNAGTMERLWQVKINGRSAASCNGRFYTCSSTGRHWAAGGLRALDAASGDVLWTHGLRRGISSRHPYQYWDGGSSTSAPAVSGGEVVYVGADDGFLYAIDAENGANIWEYEIGSAIASSPAVSGNAVFVAALDGNVYAFVAAK